MLKTIDILVIIFTLSSFILIIGSTLSPPHIQHIFTDILSIDTLSQFGEFVSLNTKGQCHLGEIRGSCVDIITTVLAGHFTGYESEETDFEVYKNGLKVIRFQKMIFASHQLCKFPSFILRLPSLVVRLWLWTIWCLVSGCGIWDVRFNIDADCLVHGLLLVACYALLCFAWEDTMSSSSDDEANESVTLRPLQKFAVITMCLSTLAGTIATVSHTLVTVFLQ